MIVPGTLSASMELAKPAKEILLMMHKQKLVSVLLATGNLLAVSALLDVV